MKKELEWINEAIKLNEGLESILPSKGYINKAHWIWAAYNVKRIITEKEYLYIYRYLEIGNELY